MKNTLKRSVLVALVAVLLLPLFTLLVPQKAFAAQTNPQDQLERWLLYRGMWSCIGGASNKAMTVSELNGGDWPIEDKKGFGYLGPDYDNGDDKDGTVQCKENNIWAAAAEEFGFGDGVGMFCAIAKGVTEVTNGSSKLIYNGDDCLKSTSYNFGSLNDDTMRSALTKALDASGDRPRFNIEDNNGPDGSYSYKALLYLIGAHSLEKFCGNGVALSEGVDDRANDDNRVSVDLVDPATGEITKSQLYVLRGDRDEDSKIDDIYYKQGNGGTNADDLRCHELAALTRGENAAAYAAWVKNNPEEAQKNQETVGGSEGAITPSCEANSGPLSWLLCAILDGLDRVIGWLDNAINRLLFIESDIYDSDAIEASWRIIRNIAFLILIPMMLLMVIGTALEFGPFDAYTVKKALPRMLVAVIFIALSLPITQFGVQVSNDIGNGVGNLIVTAVPEEQRVDSLSDVLVGGDSSAAGVAGLMAFTTYATVGGALAGGGLIGVLLSFGAVAFVGLLIGFAVLVLRQVLILMLIVIAPLAILVWIFPGNDKLWTVWKTTFIAMLMMYPLISILIASGKFVAGIANF